MNGIRLAVIAMAAFAMLQIDSAELFAQRGGGYGDFYRNNGPGKSDSKSKSKPNSPAAPGLFQDQPSEPPGDDFGGRSGSRSGDRPSSRSSSSGRRSRSSSRSRGSNAIESNPLLQFFDTDGDGELSLEEIDAASRMLYSLDENEDDRITSDEVEDMMADAGEDSGSSRSSSRSSASRSSGSRSSSRSSGSRSSSNRSTSRSRSNSRPSAPEATSKFAGGGGQATGPGGFGASAPPGPPGFGGPSRGGSRSSNSNIAEDDFEGHDRNGDGVLQRGEMPRSLRSKFTKMDFNKDKEIDEDEFYDYLDEQGR